ncbi:MAG: signal recognition particle-docking protein FtsY, partial [Chlamydiales bacterium]
FFEADLGASLSADLTNQVRKIYQKRPSMTPDEVLNEIKQRLTAELEGIPQIPSASGKPYVILIVGVNGNGKTTTVAKLAQHYKKLGKSVLIGAADTFRAAAQEQLEMWADKLSVPIVKGKPGSDPAAVAFDAIQAAKSREIDVVLIDTAGRLHTKTDLMQELEKIRRVSGKAERGAPHETLLILDATIGQNGLEQAATFHKFTPLTGLVLTKVDGTAKGGTAIAIQKKMQLPIRFFGTGEKVDDLTQFQVEEFVTNLLT